MVLDLDGKKVDAEPVEFEVAQDAWQVLKLKDGTCLRLKLVVTDVFRTNEKTEAGDDIYYVKSSTLVVPGKAAWEEP